MSETLDSVRDWWLRLAWSQTPLYIHGSDIRVLAAESQHALAAAEAKRMEAVQVLRALWNDATGGKKACEHEFTCNCAGDLARALLAREADDAK